MDEELNRKCLEDLTKFVKKSREDSEYFSQIKPLDKPMIHDAKKGKWLLLATLNGPDENKDKILNALTKNIKYDENKVLFHGCYLPGDIFVYIELPSVKTEGIDIINIASEAEKMLTDKSMEYDAKAYIRAAKANIEVWEKSLERGKQGNPCNFKDVSKKIKEIRDKVIMDKDGVLGNKHILFIDVNRYSDFIKHDFYDFIDATQQWMGKSFSSGLAREEAVKKARKRVENCEDKLDSIRADKKDYRLSFLLDEFDDLIDIIKDLISPTKATKDCNIARILDDFADVLESTGLKVDLAEDEEEKKMALKQYHYAKELMNKVMMVTKSTVGTIYGMIVTKVMSMN